MADIAQKRRLVKLLAKLSPENLDASVLDSIMFEIEKLKGSIPSPLDISPVYVKLQSVIDSVQKHDKAVSDIYSRISAIKGFSIEDKAELNELLKKRQKELVDMIDELKLDFTVKLSQKGGGAMNRKISIGGTVISTRYTDINFLGSGVTYSAVDNNATKQVDLTLSAAGVPGWTIETPTGSLYDQTTGLGGISFTSTTTGIAVFADGSTFFDGCGCTISGTSITMVNPVTQFIRVAI